MVGDRISTKVFIQHPVALDCKIVGILEQLAPSQSSHGRKIALVRTAFTFYFLLFTFFFPFQSDRFNDSKSLVRFFLLDSSRNTGVSISPSSSGT